MNTYELAQRVKALGVSDQAVYRLVRAKGRPKLLYPQLLAALCEVFGIELGELLVRDPPAKHANAKKRL